MPQWTRCFHYFFPVALHCTQYPLLPDVTCSHGLSTSVWDWFEFATLPWKLDVKFVLHSLNGNSSSHHYRLFCANPLTPQTQLLPLPADYSANTSCMYFKTSCKFTPHTQSPLHLKIPLTLTVNSSPLPASATPQAAGISKHFSGLPLWSLIFYHCTAPPFIYWTQQGLMKGFVKLALGKHRFVPDLVIIF